MLLTQPRMGFEEFGWLSNPSKGTNCPNYAQAIIKIATGDEILHEVEFSDLITNSRVCLWK